MTSKIEARVTHAFRISPEQVYEAWLTPLLVRRWMAAALQEMGLAGDLRRVEIDPHIGGKFFFSDQRGELEAKHWGTYLELEPARKIVFTWIVSENDEADPSRVTITLPPQEQGCLVTLVHQMDSQWAEYVPRVEASWSRMLRHIEALLEQ